MNLDEYGFLRFSGICRFCDASSHNGNVHSQNCLLNLPTLVTGNSHKRLSPHWYNGFRLEQDTSFTREERRAYAMGIALKEEQLSAEREATAIAKNHFVSSPT